MVPPEIVSRKKQPFRAPNALCFVAHDAPAYIQDVLSETALLEANVFDPRAVASLLSKCQANAGDSDLSNSDNMALVGVLSTQLLHRHFIASRSDVHRTVELCVMSTTFTSLRFLSDAWSDTANARLPYPLCLRTRREGSACVRQATCHLL